MLSLPFTGPVNVGENLGARYPQKFSMNLFLRMNKEVFEIIFKDIKAKALRMHTW